MRVLIEAEFDCDCYVNPTRGIQNKKRFFKIEILRNDFVDVIVTDSFKKMDCHIFSFSVSFKI